MEKSDSPKKMIQCENCDGTGRVHSHNDKCWICHGKGKIEQKEIVKCSTQ